MLAHVDCLGQLQARFQHHSVERVTRRLRPLRGKSSLAT
jgi:hypothetical protein